MLEYVRADRIREPGIRATVGLFGIGPGIEGTTSSPSHREGMGWLADEVRDHLRDRLAERLPGFEWTVERDVGGTPVDVAGATADRLVAIELEWRRADPADNTAKLFRHLVEGSIEAGRVDVFQVFTAYYDLQSGGVNSKRANAEFVGEAAADALDGFEYRAVDLDVEPPRGGGEFRENWEAALDQTADLIAETV